MKNTDWQNKNVCFLGDSITDGVGVQVGERYFDLLEKELHLKACGLGRNGAKYLNIYDQAQQMKQIYGSAVDAIFIFAGTNDFFGNTPRGEWFSESTAEVVVQRNENGERKKSEARQLRSFNFDCSTYRGSINHLLSYLKHTYANTQIILLTPLHRAYACFGNESIQYNELYSNALGYFIEDYAEDVRTAARIWSTEFIDLHQISGLFPLYDESAAFFCNPETDRLHPNKEGHIRLAKVLAAKMQTIPLF